MTPVLGARVLVIAPTYNELDNVKSLIASILQHVPAADVLVVDDGSPDGTGQAVQEIMRVDRRVRLLERPRKLGLGTAYLAGFQEALRGGYQYGVTMDADFSHDPQHLPAMLQAAAVPGVDLTIGSRYINGGRIAGWGIGRRLMSRTANLIARNSLRLRTHDCTGGYRCYGRRTLEALSREAIRSQGYSALIELLWICERGGCQVTEVPITFTDRRAGASKISRSEISRALSTIVRLAHTKKAVARRADWLSLPRSSR
jgi:glycosyltransferase involved in cell wall biosynthesis